MYARFFGGLIIVCFIVSFLIFYVFDEGANQEYYELLRFNKYQVYMSPFRFMIVALVIAFFGFVVKKSSVGMLGKLYPTNIFFLFITFMILPGVFLTSDYTSSGVTSFYSYAFSVFLFSLGILTATIFKSAFRVNSNHFYSGYPIVYSKLSVIYILFILIYLFSMLIFFQFSNLQVSVFNYIAQFIVSGTVSTDVREVAEARQAIYTDGGGYKGFLAILSSYSIVMLMPLSCAFLFVNSLLKKSKIEMSVALLFITINFMLLIANGMRLRGMFFILYIVIAYSFIRPIKFSHVRKLGVFIFFLLIIQTIALGRMVPGAGFIENIILSANRVIERVFLTKGYVTQKVFEYIPEFSDYKNGETFVVALGGQLKNSDILFAEEMNEFILGYAGTAGPQAFAEGYANFGLIGMFALAFILGIVIQLSTYFVKSVATLDPLKISFLAYFSVLLGRVGYGDTFTFKNNGLHVLLVIWLVVILGYRFISFISLQPNKNSPA